MKNTIMPDGGLFVVTHLSSPMDVLRFESDSVFKSWSYLTIVFVVTRHIGRTTR